MKISVLIMCSVRWYNASAHYALYTASCLKKSGLNVKLFGIPGSPLLIKAKEQGIEVIESIGLPDSGFFHYIKNILKFRKLLKKSEFDLINPHISRDHVFAFLSLPGKNRHHILRTRTDSKVPKNNILNRMFYRISSKYYIVSSRYMLSHLTVLGITGERIIPIPLDIDYKNFALYKSGKNLKKKLNISENKIVVSFIGRLDTVKGVGYFLKSHDHLKNKKKFHYLVSGDEINLTVEDLKKEASGIDPKSVSFLGRMDDVREILKITDIGVIPSIGSESICRVGLEMLSFGIPVIGSNINSIPEIINEFGGIVVSPRSPEEIADAIEYLAVRKNYKKIKKAILKNISERQPDKFLMEYMEVLNKLEAIHE
jgi:glycosyltransferase involved in cell wall biosynthesis